jgi:hypothetical protein
MANDHLMATGGILYGQAAVVREQALQLWARAPDGDADIALVEVEPLLGLPARNMPQEESRGHCIGPAFDAHGEYIGVELPEFPGGEYEVNARL